MTMQASQAPGAHPGGSAREAISLHGVHKNFGTVQAVRGLDLAIGHGEVVAFLGPNGAGKTTTIDMILGLSQPTAGDVSVFGLAPRQAISRGLVSAVLQTGGLLPDMTVAETARYTASLFLDPRPVSEDRHHESIGRCKEYAKSSWQALFRADARSIAPHEAGIGEGTGLTHPRLRPRLHRFSRSRTPQARSCCFATPLR